MSLYRKKPDEVDAIQWNGNNQEVIDFCKADGVTVSFTNNPDGSEGLVVTSKMGDMKFNKLDYILKSAKESVLRCTPETFAIKYESIG